ncbi:hypothetical protein PVPAM_000039000 [Plasmodium vivax]|nr:hypothetical protein PVPAM_000039000 [Plasmodium vivax]
MSDDSPEPDYFSYNDYTKVRNKLNKCNYKYEEKERFDKILSRITNKNSVNWNDKIFACLHNYLTYNNGFTGISVEHTCRYINFWLNREVRESGNANFQLHFNSFKDFVDNYAHVQQGHDRDSCKKYINKIEDGHHGRMKYLYEFYDFYDELKNPKYWRKEKPCDEVLKNSFIYSSAIEDYYEKYPNLYAKISPVRDLIDEILNKGPKLCERTVYFTIPPKFLKDEETRLQKIQEAERLKKQQEDERQIRERQAELEAQNRMQQMSTNHGVQQEGLREAGPQLLEELGNSRETVNLQKQQASGALSYTWRSDNSGRYEHVNEPVLRQQYEGQLDTTVPPPGNEDTKPDGSILGSLRLPSGITEVLGSVEPGPVLGVSGGMGALFLLFKYTPVGTFFRGGRVRARRIPSGFSGPFPGDFANFQDYGGGFVGYSPMDINPLAE